jgi:hypothetical protein
MYRAYLDNNISAIVRNDETTETDALDRLLEAKTGLILKRAGPPAPPASGRTRTTTCSPTAMWSGASTNHAPESRWGWPLITIVPGTAGVTNGTAETREEAMAKFRAA